MYQQGFEANTSKTRQEPELNADQLMLKLFSLFSTSN
jgi:hypothetical protein